MSELHSLFTELLEIEAPFSLGKVEQERVNNKIASMTFTIDIDKQYRPSKYHNIHSYYVKKWRHLSLFQYPCFIEARLPVFMDKRTNKTSVIDVPWARKGSGFTLLFEEDMLDLLRLCNCVKTTATFFDLYPQRVQTVYDAYTKDAYEQREAEVAKKVDKEELAFHVKQFDELWIQPNCQAAAAFFCYWLDRTENLYKMASFRKSMFRHFQGIINFVESKVTNGMLEGMNSKIQFIKRAARGYRNTENFKRMIFFAFNAL